MKEWKGLKDGYGHTWILGHEVALGNCAGHIVEVVNFVQLAVVALYARIYPAGFVECGHDLGGGVVLRRGGNNACVCEELEGASVSL